MALPIVLVCLPVFLFLYIAWNVFGPVPTPRSFIRSASIGAEDPNASEGPPRRNIKFKNQLTTDKDGLETIPQLMRATFEKVRGERDDTHMPCMDAKGAFALLSIDCSSR